MKSRPATVFCMLFISLMINGCAGPKSYVDPGYGKITYNDVSRRTDPYKVKMAVEFQRNGKHIPQVDSELMGHVDRVIRASGFAFPDNQSPSVSGEMKIIVNNIADMGTARAKGFGTGLTFGLVGSTVTDNYEMQVTITIGDKTVIKSGYKHALHTTIGHASAPQGLEPMTAAAAFGKIVEELVLNFLADIQRSGEFTLLLRQQEHHAPTRA